MERVTSAQLGLFDTVDREKREKLMQAIDKVNGEHRQLIKLAVQGNGREWKLKQEQLSQRYTTKLSDIIKIKT